MVASSLPPLLQTIKNQLWGTSPWTLQDVPDFPLIAWNNQTSYYKLLPQWYDGTQLLETTSDKASDKAIEKYPIKINPIQNTCEKHASTLFGTTLDSIRQGAMPIKFTVDPNDVEEKQIHRIEKALRNVFSDNHCGSIFMQDAIHSQYLGGCVWAATWLDKTKRILISSPLPSEFIGIPDGIDYYNLKEAWIIKELTADELKSYVEYTQSGNDTQWWYIEHWTKTSHTVQINGTSLITDESNPFGIVPIVYIPHIRVRGFLGKSIISEMVKGLVREINLREADIGDSVSEDTHAYIWVRNVRGSLKTVQIGDGRAIIDLGSTSGLTGNESNPDMQAVRNSSASEPMLNFNKSLYDLYRIETNHPAVADGVDQGSQRSSVTLNARMWPLTAHVEAERIFWSVGMTIFAKILLKIMSVKDQYDITEEDINPQLVIGWAPMLPRDRDMIVQEVAVRAKNKVGSVKHLMQLLGDTPDVDAELEQIRSEMDLFIIQQQPFGQSGQSGQSEQPPKGTSGKPTR